MALHPDFPDSPHAVLDPDVRWFPADEALRETSMEKLMPPLVPQLRKNEGFPDKERPLPGTEERFSQMHAGTAQNRGQGGGYLRQRHDDHCRNHGGRKIVMAKINVLNKEITSE